MGNFSKLKGSECNASNHNSICEHSKYEVAVGWLEEKEAKWILQQRWQQQRKRSM
jgi:hypothetical protein